MAPALLDANLARPAGASMVTSIESVTSAPATPGHSASKHGTPATLNQRTIHTHYLLQHFCILLLRVAQMGTTRRLSGLVIAGCGVAGLLIGTWVFFAANAMYEEHQWQIVVDRITAAGGSVGPWQITSSSPSVPLKDIETIDFRGFSRARIDDASLARLRTDLERFRKLRILTLTQTDITDAALPNLYDLDSLETIFLNETQVTDAGVEALKREIPGVRIIQ